MRPVLRRGKAVSSTALLPDRGPPRNSYQLAHWPTSIEVCVDGASRQEHPDDSDRFPSDPHPSPKTDASAARGTACGSTSITGAPRSGCEAAAYADRGTSRLRKDHTGRAVVSH